MFYGGLAGLIFAALITLIFISRQGKIARTISLLATFASCAVLLLFSSIVIYLNLKIPIALYQITPILNFSFLIDRLSAFFIMVVSLISMCVSLYSIDYVGHMQHKGRKNLLASLMALFILSMVLVTASANMFSFLFFWEIMALSSFFLVMFEFEKKDTGKAGIFYFVMTNLSTVFLLFGFLLLYHATGSLDISPAKYISPLVRNIVFLSLFFGFGIKAGVIPFHKWLPYAHPASPSNISALMSGVMIKVAIYGMMRFVLSVLGTELWWGVLLLFAGTISAVLGVIYALKEHNIKRLLAYHSIENIGIILLGFALYIIFTSFGMRSLAVLGLAGALFHTLNHAVFKSLLFMAAGSVVNATGTKNIEDMGGLIKRMPKTALFFLIGAVSISALPPFNGFVSELMIFQAFFGATSLASPLMQIALVLSLAAFALTSALAAACFVKAFGTVFLAMPRSREAESAKEAPFMMLLGPGILSIICIIFGVFSYQIFSFFGYTMPIPDLLIVGGGMAAIYAAVSVGAYIFSRGSPRTAETWGCGIMSQNPRMEYTASGFSEPIVTIFKPIYRTEKHACRNYFDTKNSIFSGGTAEIHLVRFFEERLYMPVAKLAESVSVMLLKIQKGDVDLQIAYAFVAVVALIVAVGWIA